MPELVLRASAKINLDLRVLGRRADGFHELRTVFQSVALHDDVKARRVRGPFRLECDTPGVPLDRTNLAWRAADAAWRAAGGRGPVRDVALTLVKRIPTAAGLGGGSSDAAAALMAVNRLLGLGLDAAALHRAAGSVGSDVPFFLVGGTALGLGRGEDLFPLPDVPPHYVVLVRPPFGVNTADAYRWYAESAAAGTEGRGQTQLGQTLRLAVPWRAGGLELVNDLERAVLPRHPEIAAVQRALLGAGAAAARMAGSGSTVFGLFADAGAARAAARPFERPGWTVILTRTLGRRTYLGRLAGPRPIE